MCGKHVMEHNESQENITSTGEEKSRVLGWLKGLGDLVLGDEDVANTSKDEESASFDISWWDLHLQLPKFAKGYKSTYRGVFKTTNRGDWFCPSEAGCGGEMPIVCNGKCEPIIIFCEKFQIEVRLTVSLVRGERILKANALQVVSSGQAEGEKERPVDIKLVEKMSERLRGCEEGIEQRPIMPMKQKKYTSITDLRSLFVVCGTTYPPDLRQWAEENFANYVSPHTDSQEKRHIQNALAHILNVDWSIHEPQLESIRTIKADLDRQFYGLTDVKVRILEIISQLKHSHSMPKWGVLLCGPAGTGKSTVAKAIAKALNMPVVELAMSTIADGEALTGTSRIYSNAKPGYIVEKIYSEGTASVVLLINELDKATGTQLKSSPAEVLLTLMDGLGFTDNFIEASIPTDKMFFIATCNDPDKISKPILDRFLRIDIPAYSSEDKYVILKNYVLPQLMRENRLTKEEFDLDEEAARLLCSSYAVEPGVRDLEQYVEKIISHYLLEVSMGGAKNVCCHANDIQRLLGPKKVVEQQFSANPGLVLSAFSYNGKAYTVPVEASVLSGSGKLEVVNVHSQAAKDSCTAAYICARNTVRTCDFSKYDVSIYVPSEIPPGAKNFLGVAVYAAIISAIGNLHFLPGAAFLGGCDFFGNTFFDDTDVMPYLRALANRGVKTVYAPRGTGALVCGACDEGIEVIEGNDITTLIEMAVYSSAIESGVEE